MAVKRESRSRLTKRVNLSRPGSKKKGNVRTVKAYEKTDEKDKKNIFSQLPFGKFFTSAGILCAGVIFIAFLSLAVLYGYRLITTSDYFLLKTVKITGNTRVTSKEILDSIGLAESTNILALSIDTVEATLSMNPWVQKVSVKRVMPESLVINVEEKQPAFWVLRDGTLYYATELGTLIAPVEPGRFSSLPTLEVESGAEKATQALPDLVKSLRESQIPLGLSEISWVRLSASRGVEVYVEGSHLRVSIGLEDWLANLERLGVTVSDLKRRGELPKVRSIEAHGVNVWVEKAL